MDKDKKTGTVRERMKKLFKFCYKHSDKLLHALGTYSFQLSAVVLFGSRYFGLTMTVTALLSAAKEVMDELLFENGSAGDLVADLIGMVGATFTALLGGLL